MIMLMNDWLLMISGYQVILQCLSYMYPHQLSVMIQSIVLLVTPDADQHYM